MFVNHLQSLASLALAFTVFDFNFWMTIPHVRV